jgi:hypothetical protein
MQARVWELQQGRLQVKMAAVPPKAGKGKAAAGSSRKRRKPAAAAADDDDDDDDMLLAQVAHEQDTADDIIDVTGDDDSRHAAAAVRGSSVRQRTTTAAAAGSRHATAGAAGAVGSMPSHYGYPPPAAAAVAAAGAGYEDELIDDEDACMALMQHFEEQQQPHESSRTPAAAATAAAKQRRRQSGKTPAGSSTGKGKPPRSGTAPGKARPAAAVVAVCDEQRELGRDALIDLRGKLADWYKTPADAIFSKKQLSKMAEAGAVVSFVLQRPLVLDCCLFSNPTSGERRLLQHHEVCLFLLRAALVLRARRGISAFWSLFVNAVCCSALCWLLSWHAASRAYWSGH